MLHFYLTGHQIELETCSAVPSVPVTIQLFKSEHRKNNFHHLAADRALPQRWGGRHIDAVRKYDDPEKLDKEINIIDTELQVDSFGITWKGETKKRQVCLTLG